MLQNFLFKEDINVVSKPRDAIYKDRNEQKKMMQETEVHKFSDGTLCRIQDKLDYKVGDEVGPISDWYRMKGLATTSLLLRSRHTSGLHLIQSIDPPLPRGYTLGSGEDSMKLIGIDDILYTIVI
ncbi:hypothetical protein Tco_1532969 [Tanacetum coccineum]